MWFVGQLLAVKSGLVTKRELVPRVWTNRSFGTTQAVEKRHGISYLEC